MMNAIRQHEPGKELVFESVPVPQPGKGEVLVKMHASPINPSDLALLAEGYLNRAYPFIPGLEGSGTVIKSGGGWIAGMRVGKRVACSPGSGNDGTWADYMKTSAMHVTPFPASLTNEQGAMMLINPMTAMALMNMAKKEKHQAMVNNAAGSALGKMLIRLSNRYRIPLINIVRREEQMAELQQLGASYVIHSESNDFEEELKQLSGELNATLVLDAITGAQSSLLLNAAPQGSKLVAYARLSGDPMKIDPADLIKEKKQVVGFQLGHWLQSKSIPSKLRLVNQVKKHLPEALKTQVSRTIPLKDAAEGILHYRQHMSDGKILLTM
jgi:NADPH:quinone reductase-like Zn-dependent oxidoreductase